MISKRIALFDGNALDNETGGYDVWQKHYSPFWALFSPVCFSSNISVLCCGSLRILTYPLFVCSLFLLFFVTAICQIQAFQNIGKTVLF